MIVYCKGSNTLGALGRLETPIKMIIEHESDIMKKKGGICDWLFNIEKSNKFAETIIGQNEFEIFEATLQGAAAQKDAPVETYRKFIEHIQYMKEFVITAEMIEDANYGIAADAKRRIQNFTRAYYKTINKICEAALINGTIESASIASTTIDITTPDGLPLFNCEHSWGSPASASGNYGLQSNYFYGNFFDGENAATPGAFETVLSEVSARMRNMKDENGEALGYTADTIIIPGNRTLFESAVKKVCGSLGSTGSSYNDINLHFGNWNVIVLPNWTTTDDRFMIMSSEANKTLAGNMFFNRVPLTITNWIDHHTGNYLWNGRCRFGVGFGTYKHICLAVNSTETLFGATSL